MGKTNDSMLLYQSTIPLTMTVILPLASLRKRAIQSQKMMQSRNLGKRREPSHHNSRSLSGELPDHLGVCWRDDRQFVSSQSVLSHMFERNRSLLTCPGEQLIPDNLSVAHP